MRENNSKENNSKKNNSKGYNSKDFDSKKLLTDFVYDEDGAATIEIAIITMALVAVALVFKKQLLSLTKAIADKILG